MFESLRTFTFLFGYLPIAAARLKKIKAQEKELSKEEYASLVQSEPRKWAAGILKRTKSEVKISGVENLPEGAVLLVSNHEGNFDIPVLLSCIPKPFGFISKKEVKKFPVIPVYMEEMNCVFLDRSNRRSALKALTDTVEVLKAGHSILIFPEGTRSKGGNMGEFKSGFVRIAKDAGVPILPIAISGTAGIMEKNNHKIKPGKIDVHILNPFSASKVARTDNKILIAEVHNCIGVALKEMAE